MSNTNDQAHGRSIQAREKDRPCRKVSALRVYHHRFGAVVGEWVIQPCFSLHAAADRRKRDGQGAWQVGR